MDVFAIVLIGGAEFPPQHGFLEEDDKKVQQQKPRQT
jgi:hypothetical protein